MTTLGGGVLPSTASSAAAGLSPLPLLTAASPPLATRYRTTSAPSVSWLPSSKRPSLFVRAWASCLGSAALAAQRITVEFASGPPPAWTWPSTRTPDRCCANPSVLAAVTAPNTTSTANQIILVTLMVRSLQCITMREPTVWSQHEPFASTQQSRVPELVGDGW